MRKESEFRLAVAAAVGAAIATQLLTHSTIIYWLQDSYACVGMKQLKLVIH